VLDDIVNMLSDLLLAGHCLRNMVGCSRVDFLSQVEEEVEVSVFEAALLHVLVFAHVLLQVLLGRFVADHRRKVAFLYDGEFVVLGRTESDLD
jgi:sorbitol-specific phosphotransferase system component IIC